MNQDELMRMKQQGALTDKEYLMALEQLHNQERTRTQTDPEIIRKRILFSITILGIFSVLTGLGLIIAANWTLIPAMVKVGTALAFLALSISGAIYFQNRHRPYWTEAFLFISFWLVGGNIALIQQTYHLNISWTTGSFIWWALSLPFVFMTKHRTLPCCSVALLGFTLWDYVWKINYMLTAGILFVFMMFTHFFNNKTMLFLRKLAFVIAIFILYVGDLNNSNGVGLIGAISTTLFLLLSCNTSKNELGIVRYYNYLFVFVAWRIFLLFWTAYYNLADIGILLVAFGSILLAGVAFYYYYFNQIQELIQKFVIHKE